MGDIFILHTLKIKASVSSSLFMSKVKQLSRPLDQLKWYSSLLSARTKKMCTRIKRLSLCIRGCTQGTISDECNREMT